MTHKRRFLCRKYAYFHFRRDKAGSDAESDKEDLVADIFGGSSDEEEFEGFAEADVEATAKKKEKKTGTTISSVVQVQIFTDCSGSIEVGLHGLIH